MPYFKGVFNEKLRKQQQYQSVILWHPLCFSLVQIQYQNSVGDPKNG